MFFTNKNPYILSYKIIIICLLQEKGGDFELKCEDNRTSLQYAILEEHFNVVNYLKTYIFEKKIEKMKRATKYRCVDKNLLNVENDIDNLKYTPNKIHYNFDVTSPYYINITHRRKIDKNQKNIELQNSQTETLPHSVNETISRNLFELTENNLTEFNRDVTEFKSRRSLIDSWRDKVNAPNRISILHNSTLPSIDKIMCEIDEMIRFEEAGDESSLGCDVLSTDTESFLTAQETIKSLNKRISANETYIIQVAENYVHTDDENGMVFYERKVLPSTVNCKKDTDLNSTHSTVSTAITVPAEYDTDDLRNELTCFGHPPGPITKFTKRLYLKRLIKFKRNPALATNRPKSNTNPSK